MCYSLCRNGVRNSSNIKKPITVPITTLGFVGHSGQGYSFLVMKNVFGMNFIFGLNEDSETSILNPRFEVLPHALGVLPKIPFKWTQAIHVALQKSCYFD